MHFNYSLKLIANWLATLGKEARRVKRIHLEDISDKADTQMSEIERFSTNEAMTTSLYNAVEKAKKGKKIPQVDIRQIMIWLAGSLLHLNAQRPGAITNTTLEEYRAATVSTIGRESYTTILVANHKTATTGRAKFCTQEMDDALESGDKERMQRVLGRMKEWEREPNRQDLKEFNIDIDGKNNIKLPEVIILFPTQMLVRDKVGEGVEVGEMVVRPPMNGGDVLGGGGGGIPEKICRR